MSLGREVALAVGLPCVFRGPDCALRWSRYLRSRVLLALVLGVVVVFITLITLAMTVFFLPRIASFVALAVRLW